MNVRTVHEAKHNCAAAIGWPHHGKIVECSCGKWWRGNEPGNPDYATWRRAWARQLLGKPRQAEGDGT